MNVLIDSNVILDALLRRGEFAENAARILALSEKGLIDGYVSASAVTDIYYIISKTIKNKSSALALLKKLLSVIHVASVTDNIIREAVALEWNDFEDCIQYVVGKGVFSKYIITRNPKDFSEGSVEVISPDQFIEFIESSAVHESEDASC